MPSVSLLFTCINTHNASHIFFSNLLLTSSIFSVRKSDQNTQSQPEMLLHLYCAIVAPLLFVISFFINLNMCLVFNKDVSTVLYKPLFASVTAEYGIPGTSVLVQSMAAISQ